MNPIHETVYSFLEQHYPEARARPHDAANLDVTMPNGDTYTLGINLLGEILTDTGEVIATPTRTIDPDEYTHYTIPDEWRIETPL